jgi:hypothetical protein
LQILCKRDDDAYFSFALPLHDRPNLHGTPVVGAHQASLDLTARHQESSILVSRKRVRRHGAWPPTKLESQALGGRNPTVSLVAAPELCRSARKRKLILDAATTAFPSRGYDGTSMDDVAALAAVSKPTVYKHFSDKERLFTNLSWLPPIR